MKSGGPPPGQDELRRDNQRLAMQVRRLQDVVAAMRDEIADANAEIVASRRLHDEQKALLLQELHRERAWREQLQKVVKGGPKISIGVNTVTDVATTTTAETGTMAFDPSDDDIDDEGYYLEDRHGRSRSNSWAATRAPRRGARETMAYQQMSAAVGRERVLQEFADSISRRTNYHDRDLYKLFKSLGATTVDEVCANISEQDLVGSGVPVLKARAMMHLIMEHTSTLLQQSGGLVQSPSVASHWYLA